MSVTSAPKGCNIPLAIETGLTSSAAACRYINRLMRDRRNPSPRYQLRHEVSLLLDQDGCRVFCELKDMSLTGARLSKVPLKSIPETFRFLISTEEVVLPCRVRWTSTSEIGVEFTGEPEFRDGGIDRLWTRRF